MAPLEECHLKKGAMKMDRLDVILSKLRSEGYRITEQRKLLIGVILENECSSCKEIYYKAIKADPTIGIATVYRIIKTLEDLELINRKNLYSISYDKVQDVKDHQVILVSEEDGTIHSIPKGKWFDMLQAELKIMGLVQNKKVSMVIKTSAFEEGEEDDQLYYSCECDNERCSYNRKRFKIS